MTDCATSVRRSLTDPHISVEAELELSEALRTGPSIERDPRATRTVAMPGARPPKRRALAVVESSPEVQVLTSGDISIVSAGRADGLPERAVTAAPPLADPLLGIVVADRYRILEPIGRGGMGVVYKVEHVRIGKLLAMKLLTGELSRSADMVRRFKREALTVSRLASPSTVQVFDFGVSDGLTYLVMELVHGESLGRVLAREGPMPSGRVCKIMVQVASSLAEAHRKGIVHRDVKPENIMLISAFDGTDLAKVLDFGLAKLRESEGHADITNLGTILGTPYYMAPE